MEKPLSEPVFCSRPWTGFEIEHDGTVRQCCMTKVSTCGNINHQSIKDIWNGEIYQELRSKMAAGQWKDICREECPKLHGEFDDAVPTPITQAFADNYNTNRREIETRAIILESLPRFWKITHSTRCNLNCIMCYQDRNDLRELPDEFYRELSEFNTCIQEMELLGGETFAIKRFREFISRFPKTSFPDVCFSFVTNGTVYDETILNIVKEVRVSWLSISIDAASDETYAKIRKGGHLPDTRIGIGKWTSLARDAGFPILLSFTVMRNNLHEMSDFLQLARQYNVDCIFGIVQGEKGEQHNFDKTEFKNSLLKAADMASQFQAEMPIANLTLKSLFPLAG